MLPVFICEDNPSMLKRYKTLIENMILMDDYDLKLITATAYPEQLLNVARTYFYEKKSFGAFYLLDIELKSNMNGLKLAQEIRRFDTRGFIVFITSYSNLAPLTFKYQTEALGFITKDSTWNINAQIRSCIELALKRYYHSPQIPILTFQANRHIFNIEQDNIIYIAASDTPHKLYISTLNGKTEFYGTLNECDHYLTDKFVRCHRAYIVNIDHVKCIDRNTHEICLTNGQSCIASTRGIKRVLEAIENRKLKEHLQKP